MKQNNLNIIIIIVAVVLIIGLGFVSVSMTGYAFKEVGSSNTTYDSCLEAITADNGGNVSVSGYLLAYKGNVPNPFTDYCVFGPNQNLARKVMLPDGTEITASTRLREYSCNGKKLVIKAYDASGNTVCVPETINITFGNSIITADSAKLIELSPACKVLKVKNSVQDQNRKVYENSCGKDGLTFTNNSCSNNHVVTTTKICKSNCDLINGCDACVDSDPTNDILIPGVAYIKGTPEFKTDKIDKSEIIQYSCTKDGKIIKLDGQNCPPYSYPTLNETNEAAYCTKTVDSITQLRKDLQTYESKTDTRLDKIESRLVAIEGNLTRVDSVNGSLLEMIGELQGQITEVKGFVNFTSA